VYSSYDLPSFSGETSNLHMDYQKWYSKCMPMIEQVLPDCYNEFTEQYKLDKRKEITYATYTIGDFFPLPPHPRRHRLRIGPTVSCGHHHFG